MLVRSDYCIAVSATVDITGSGMTVLCSDAHGSAGIIYNCRKVELNGCVWSFVYYYY